MWMLSYADRRGAIVDYSLLMTDYMDMGTGYHQQAVQAERGPATGAGYGVRSHTAPHQQLDLATSDLTAISGYDNETCYPAFLLSRRNYMDI